jgi:hypothetical protein
MKYFVHFPELWLCLGYQNQFFNEKQQCDEIQLASADNPTLLLDNPTRLLDDPRYS